MPCSRNRKGSRRAFVIGQDFIGNDTGSLILGDNILYGNGMGGNLVNALQRESGATVFAYRVGDPER